MESGPKFRADHVGSLLRPQGLAKLRKGLAIGDGRTGQRLRKAENAEIAKAIKRQEDIGLLAVTDGEYRRSFWHYDFMGMLDGIDLEEREEGIQFAGKTLRPIYPVIRSRLAFPDDHPMLDHFRYVAATTSATPKMSIPGPSCCHFRVAIDDIHPKEYRDVEALLFDIADTYRKAVEAFYDAGCRYLQMDDIFFAYLCDPKHRQSKIDIGQDPDWLIDRYAWMMNEAIRQRPKDMTIAMHMCRGNFRSTHAAAGGYDPAADAIFNRTGVDVFFMEYDTERAGGLEPLGLLSKGKQRVMPGFITTKSGALESIEVIRRKLDEASRYADIEQLGIAPQCGFASTEEGNELSEDEQWKKLELVVRVAEDVWGGV